MEADQRQRWRFVYEGYKSDHVYQRLFIFIFLLRVILINVVLGCLYSYPMMQAFSILIINVGMSYYLIWASPIQQTINKVQHLIIETALLFYNTIVFSLTILDLDEDEENMSIKKAIGQLMNILYLITPVLTAMIIVFRLLQNIYHKTHDSSSSRNVELPGHIQLSQINSDSDAEGERTGMNEEIPFGKNFLFPHN